jgi:hypothetical protein
VNREKWTFESNIGFEGRASIEGANSIKMKVECGSGGGPFISSIGSNDL